MWLGSTVSQSRLASHQHGLGIADGSMKAKKSTERGDLVSRVGSETIFSAELGTRVQMSSFRTMSMTDVTSSVS